MRLSTSMHGPSPAANLIADARAAGMFRSVNAMPRRLAAGLAMLLLIGALFLAGKWGVAATGNAFAMWHFDDWRKSDHVPDVRTWKWMHELMRWSTRLDPENAGYRNDMGRLYEYTALNMIQHPSQVTPLLQISLSFFHDAVRLRPSWARAWANLVLIKLRLRQIDAEFLFAMNRAVQLGPAVPAVQQIVAEAGVANWRRIPVATQQLVLRNIHIGLGSLRRREIAAIIAHYHMTDYFCGNLPESDREQICGQVVKKDQKH